MTIKCLNCHGTGYNVKLGWDGVRRPVRCKGCNGTGCQTVVR